MNQEYVAMAHRRGMLSRPYVEDMDGHQAELWSFSRACLAHGFRSPKSAPLETAWTERIAEETGVPARTSSFVVPNVILARTLDASSGLVAGQGVTVGDALRPVLVAGKAGCATVSGIRGGLHVATVSATSPYWVGDGDGPGAVSEPTIGRVVVEPRQVRTTARFTTMLLEASVGEARVDRLLIADQARALAGGLDAAIFTGTGSDDQPEGLLHNSDVPVIVGGADGAVIAWGHLQQMLQSVLEAGGDPDRVVWVMSPRIARQLMSSTVPTSGDDTRLCFDPDLGRGGTLLGKPVIVSSTAPDNLTKGNSTGVCSAVFCGDFQHLLLAFWGALEVHVDPFTHATSGIVRVTSSLTVGVAVRRPTCFAIMKDALVSF